MMRVEARRLYLRPLTDADCTDTYVGWLNDPLVKQYLETRHNAQTLAAVKEFVERVNARDDEHLFGIFLKAGDRHIGNIKVGPLRAHHDFAEISLLIGERDCWGQGYAAEAIDAVSRYAFEALGVRKLGANMYAPNQGSCRAFLRVGYHQEGLRRAHYVLDGKRCDLIELGLLPDDLP